MADKIQSKIPVTQHHFSEWLKNENRNVEQFLLNPTSPLEVSEVLKSLSDNKATGPHSIPYSIISSNLESLSSIFSDIINLSFSTGVFPSQLKEAKVIPVFKNKGSPFDAENYRPISLLSNIDKIFQKLMHKLLINFLDKLHSIYLYNLDFVLITQQNQPFFTVSTKFQVLLMRVILGVLFLLIYKKLLILSIMKFCFRSLIFMEFVAMLSNGFVPF